MSFGFFKVKLNPVEFEIQIMKLKIRKASHADAKLIYAWRSDDVAVKNSFSAEPFTYQSHEKWYRTQLDSSKSHMFIGLISNTEKEFGVVRFNISEEHVCKVSINIAPEWRGQGLGSELLCACIERYSEWDGLIFTAEIKRENIASQKCFERCGFTLYRDEVQKLLYVNKQLLIDKIESVRTRNNVNWMNLMRLAFKMAPHEAEKIFESINQDDQSIANLLKILTKKVV